MRKKTGSYNAMKEQTWNKKILKKATLLNDRKTDNYEPTH